MMKKFLKAIAYLYAGIVTANATTVIFNGQEYAKDCNYIKFETAVTHNSNCSHVTIQSVSIEEDKLTNALNQGENVKEVTLIIPGAIETKDAKENSRVLLMSTGGTAFKGLKSDHLKLKVVFQAVEVVLNEISDVQYVQLCSNCRGLFSDSSAITEIDLSGASSSEVNDASYMFADCPNLDNITFPSTFCTYTIKDMEGMFSNCIKLKKLDLKNFCTNNVKNMSCMFRGCQMLQNLVISSFDTSNVKDMSCMFFSCQSLQSLDINHFNTSNVSTMESMFYLCEKLQTLNLNLDTSNVKNMSCMFFQCTNLKELNLNLDTRNVENMASMFSQCINLKNLNLRSFNTHKVTDMVNMFGGCRSLENLDIGTFNTNNVTNMSRMFSCCTNLKKLDLHNFDTQNASKIIRMFYKCENLENLIINNDFCRGKLAGSLLFEDCYKLHNIPGLNVNDVNINELKAVFRNCPAGKNFGL